MKIATSLALLAVVCLLATGCAIPDTKHMPGSIILDVGHEGQVVVDDGKVSSTKVGESTQESILGWVTNGSTAIEDARTQGNVSTITHIDYKGYSILGIVGHVTIFVYGE